MTSLSCEGAQGYAELNPRTRSDDLDSVGLTFAGERNLHLSDRDLGSLQIDDQPGKPVRRRPGR